MDRSVNHVKTQKHKKVPCKSGHQKTQVKNVGEMERQLAVQEAISALHIAFHNHSLLCQCSVPQLKLKLFSTRTSHAHRQKPRQISQKLQHHLQRKKC